MKNSSHIKCLLIFFLIKVITSCNDYTISEDQSERFVKYYPVPSFNNSGRAIIQSANGGYIIIGHATRSEVGSQNQDIMIILTDAFGKPVNQPYEYLGGPGNEYVQEALLLPDGIIIGGSVQSIGGHKSYLAKINLSGQILWEKNFEQFSEQEIRGLLHFSDGNLGLIGYSVNASGERKVCFMKVSDTGEEIWTRVIGFSGYHDVGESLIEFQGRYLLIGTSTPIDKADESSSLLLLNTDSDGRGITETRITEEYDLSARDITINTEGQITLMGNLVNQFSGFSSLYTAKVNLEGSKYELIKLNQKQILSYPESLHGETMIPGEAGSLVICGWQNEQNNLDAMFTKLDKDLNNKVINTFGAKGSQVSYDVVTTINAGYAITGSGNLGDGEVSMLIKLDSEGSL